MGIFMSASGQFFMSADTLAVERKILRRSYHTLRELGDAALAMPVPEEQGVAA